MNHFELEVALAGLEKEKQVLAQLKEIYRQALADVTEKIHISDGKIDTLLNEVDSLDEMTASEIQSQIYQKKFQENLKNQLDFLLDDVNEKQYPGIKDYLYSCYDDGFIGTLYSLNMQGVTAVAPIIPELVVRALYIDSKISTNLYEHMGEQVDELKSRISREIARGISSSMSYADIARNIANQSKFGVSNAMRIVRTEGNRIHNAASLDSAKTAKEKTGADLVKVWDSTIDKRTRKTHQELDGQVRELDEDFVNSNGKKAQAPGRFGIAKEDIHCRCVSIIQPRSEFSESFTKRNSDTGELLEFQNAKDYGEFKKKYWEWSENNVKSVDNDGGSGIIELNRKLERRDVNIGAFSDLEIPMQKKIVLSTCKKYSINTKGLTFKIQRSEKLLNTPFYGSTDYDNIGRIDLFPNAFSTEEDLVKTILHEKCHVKQLQRYGKKYAQDNLDRMEKQAYRFESIYYNILTRKK